jgi:hypothetical protein
MNLVYYHPIALKNKQPLHKCINPLISVLDRTENSWPNFEYLNLFPMLVNPEKRNFLELSYNRVKEIVNTSSHVTVMWSGGIDSTFILCLFIELGLAQQLKSQNRFTIGLNLDSIKENPLMYENIIKKDFIDCVVQADKILTNPDKYGSIITGEMADNLVGSLTMKSCVDFYNDFSVVHETWKTRGLSWFIRNLTADEKPQVAELLESLVHHAPVEIQSSHDLFWYLNFNMKWQAVNFRIVSHCKDQDTGNKLINQLVHFFNTEDFQHWSLSEGHYFTGSKWGDYKMCMKEPIFKVTGDSNYLKYKTKHPSLPSLLRYKDTFDFIYKDNDRYIFTKEMI